MNTKGPSHPSQPLGQTLTWLLQGLSGLAAVAFIASVGISGWVFGTWGLNFAQLATPADVLMGGVDFLLTVSAPLAVIAFGAFAGFYLKRDLRAGIQPYFRVLCIALAGAGFVLALRVEPGLIGQLMMFLGLSLFASREPSELARPAGAAGKARAMTNVGVVLLAVAAFALQMVLLGMLGFQARNTSVESDALPAGCANRLLWLGERTAVISCAPENAEHQQPIAVVSNDGLILRPGPKSPFQTLKHRLAEQSGVEARRDDPVSPKGSAPPARAAATTSRPPPKAQPARPAVPKPAADEKAAKG